MRKIGLGSRPQEWLYLWKMVVFGNKWLYLVRIDCICAKWYYSKSSNKPPEGLLNFGPYGGGLITEGSLLKRGGGLFKIL